MFYTKCFYTTIYLFLADISSSSFFCRIMHVPEKKANHVNKQKK